MKDSNISIDSDKQGNFIVTKEYKELIYNLIKEHNNTNVEENDSTYEDLIRSNKEENKSKNDMKKIKTVINEENFENNKKESYSIIQKSEATEEDFKLINKAIFDTNLEEQIIYEKKLS